MADITRNITDFQMKERRGRDILSLGNEMRVFRHWEVHTSMLCSVSYFVNTGVFTYSIYHVPPGLLKSHQ